MFNMLFTIKMLRFLLDAILLTGLLMADTVILNTDQQHIAVALLGSMSGCVVLLFYRRERTYKEAALKAVTAGLGGVVLGAMLERYFQVTVIEYTLGLFFFSSLLCLIFYKMLLSFTESNIGNIFSVVVGRMLNISIVTNKKIVITDSDDAAGDDEGSGDNKKQRRLRKESEEE